MTQVPDGKYSGRETSAQALSKESKGHGCRKQLKSGEYQDQNGSYGTADGENQQTGSGDV